MMKAPKSKQQTNPRTTSPRLNVSELPLSWRYTELDACSRAHSCVLLLVASPLFLARTPCNRLRSRP